MANQTIPAERERLIISKLLVGLFRELMRHMPEWYDAAGAEGYIIGPCVFIGHIERRPMTASNIAAYSGLPRTTILRKLNLMMIAGIIERRNHQYCLSQRALARTAQVVGIVKLIREASRQLSGMDKDPSSGL